MVIKGTRPFRVCAKGKEKAMPKVKAGNIELYYEQFGAGTEPLVLAHGYTQSRAHWQALVKALPLDTLRVYAFDLRGHGRSDAPADGYTMSQVADDLAAATQELGLESFNFAGHSMGGNVGIALAGRHPERLRSLVVVCGAPADGIGSVDPEGSILAAAKENCGDAEKYWAWIETWAGRPIAGELLDSFKRAYEPCAALEQAYNGVKEDLSHLLPRITVPTLVVTGDRDVLRDANLSTAARIPGSGLHVFYRAGHMLEMEVPLELAGLIVDFIEQTALRPAAKAAAIPKA
jgi:pimeloyl-ACP methyl ester carboxylesterase